MMPAWLSRDYDVISRAKPSRKPFREDATRAVPVVAKELAHAQRDPYGIALPGQVQQRAAIPTVDALRPPPAAGAGRAWSHGSGGEDDHAVVDAEAVKSQDNRVGQKGMGGHAAVLPA